MSLTFLKILTLLISLSGTVLSVDADTPDSGVPDGGWFAQYFTNMQTSCSPTQILAGFQSDLKPICTPFASFMASFLGGTGRNGEVMTGFNSSGSPVFLSVSELLGSILGGGGSIGQVVTGFSSTTGTPLYGSGSPWITNGANISNTNAGNVGIGTSTPGEKLEVNGKIRSISTVATDIGSIVATKDYVDSKLNGLVPRGTVCGSAIHHYGQGYWVNIFDCQGLPVMYTYEIMSTAWVCGAEGAEGPMCGWVAYPGTGYGFQCPIGYTPNSMEHSMVCYKL